MNNKGFTLIEVLVSLIIITVLILAINKTIYTVKKVNIISENNFQASIYAQNILEYLKSNNIRLDEGEFTPDELLSEEIKKYIQNDIKNTKFDNSLVKINKIYENIDSGSKVFKIKLLVKWEGVSNEKNYKIGTYIYQ